MARTRTNIEIENDYAEAIIQRFGVHTKTEAVDLALTELISTDGPLAVTEPIVTEVCSAAVALRGGHEILTLDRDLSSVAGVVGLRMHPASLQH